MRYQIENGLGEIYREQLKEIRKFAELKCPEIMQRFPNYTLHDMDHFEAVLKNLNDMSPVLDLDERNWFCLFAACYCHDLGMSHSESSRQEYWEDRNQARKAHAKRSFSIVIDELADTIKDDGLRLAIAKICEGHGRSDFDHCDFDPEFGINLRLLSALLSLADSLDLRAARRNPKDIRSTEELMNYRFLSETEEHSPIIKDKPELAQLSKVHWLRHYYSLNPSITASKRYNPIINIKFQAIVGIERDNENKLLKTDKDHYVEDFRCPIIEEIIISDPLKTIQTVSKYTNEYFSIQIKTPDGNSPRCLYFRTDPSKFLFPHELAKTAFTAGLIRSRTLELKDRDSYYDTRIEPYFCHDDFQISLSWRPATLTPSSVQVKEEKKFAAAITKVKDIAAKVWDVVLWNTGSYISYMQKLLDNESSHDEGIERLKELLKTPNRILNGELKKIYIHTDSEELPYTATRNISKFAHYEKDIIDPKNFIGGKICIANNEHRVLYNSLCRSIIRKLDLASEDQIITICNPYNGYIATLKTIQLIFLSLKNIYSEKIELTIFFDQCLNEIQVKLSSPDSYNQKLQFSELTYQQLKDVLAIEQESFSIPWKSENRFIEYLDAGNAYAIMINDNKIGGYCLVEIDTSKRFIKIIKMAVAIANRKQNIGRFIIAQIYELTKNRNLKGISLHVRKSNVGAIAFYEKLGFQNTKIMPSYYKKTGPEDAFEMCLYIANQTLAINARKQTS